MYYFPVTFPPAIHRFPVVGAEADQIETLTLASEPTALPLVARPKCWETTSLATESLRLLCAVEIVARECLGVVAPLRERVRPTDRAGTASNLRVQLAVFEARMKCIALHNALTEPAMNDAGCNTPLMRKLGRQLVEPIVNLGNVLAADVFIEDDLVTAEAVLAEREFLQLRSFMIGGSSRIRSIFNVIAYAGVLGNLGSLAGNALLDSCTSNFWVRYVLPPWMEQFGHQILRNIEQAPRVLFDFELMTDRVTALVDDLSADLR